MCILDPYSLIQFESSRNLTTIKFALPKAGVVTIKMYDVAGREVMRLINNQSSVEIDRKES